MFVSLSLYVCMLDDNGISGGVDGSGGGGGGVGGGG